MALYDETRQLPIFRAVTAAPFAAAKGTKAFFLIEGSATKDVIVRRIIVSGVTCTAVEYNSVVINKYSTAASGGTATALTKIPVESRYPAATANTCQVYTAAQTEGTKTGAIAARRLLIEAGTAVAGSSARDVVFDFTDNGEGGIALRGAAQGLGAAFGATPGSDTTQSVEVEWMESPYN